MKLKVPYIGSFFLGLLLVLSLNVQIKATHIVGGEFELVHLKDFDYQLRMILYFDVVNGNPAAADPQISAHIFRKSDNILMDIHVLPLMSRDAVFYTNIECAIDQLVTDRLFYSLDITRTPPHQGRSGTRPGSCRPRSQPTGRDAR